MISNYIFALLAQDDTDSNPEDVLEDIRIRMKTEDLAANQLPDYTYKSLKTLLGEAENNELNEHGQPMWAVSRITDGRYNRKFHAIESPQEFPLIYLNISNLGPDSKAQGHGREEARLDVLVTTNPISAPSSDAWNIIRRITHLFRVYGASGIPMTKELVEEVEGVKGLLSLQIAFIGYPVASWDTQRGVYHVKAATIQ
jgi:hypothetical protein